MGYSIENQDYEIKNYVESKHMTLVHIYQEEKGAAGKT